ncbi:hypothetical protein AMTR_s00050p00192550 [Amborella trichopoda]|uniref:Uncharacterized protein n=1 Tax=Amborella trichopoda TaxID=13333 RepID=W1PY94_AMBTC|nr:hypothetical protein AMTR_s00050p00192550 [Amborella trichopoda]
MDLQQIQDPRPLDLPSSLSSSDPAFLLSLCQDVLSNTSISSLFSAIHSSSLYVLANRLTAEASMQTKLKNENLAHVSIPLSSSLNSIDFPPLPVGKSRSGHDSKVLMVANEELVITKPVDHAAVSVLIYRPRLVTPLAWTLPLIQHLLQRLMASHLPGTQLQIENPVRMIGRKICLP